MLQSESSINFYGEVNNMRKNINTKITSSKNVLLGGLLAVILASCGSGSTASSGVKYQQFNYSTTPVYSSLITGVRGVSYSTNVYITGLFYESESSTLSQGMLYTGPVTGGGTWQVFNYPGSASTSFYGPDNDGAGGNVVVAGSYTTPESPTLQRGMIYQGPATGGGTWTSLDMSSMIVRPNESAIFTFAHSTMGGLVVGNFDTNIETGRAFIYNISADKYVELTKPNAVSITAYGIWFNQGTSYTIAGGYSDKLSDESGISIAYLVDWNSATNTASNWESFNFNNQPEILTHFEGITSDGNGGYNLAVDYIDATGIHAGIGHVGRNPDGSFTKATWATVQYPGSVVTSSNTVYENYIMGVYTLSNTTAINAYTAAVPGF